MAGAIRIVAVLIFVTLMLCRGAAPSVDGQDDQQIRLIRESFVVMPACHSCYPVEVKGIFLTGVPPEVILGEAMIENRSATSVTAVKLGWKVYPSSKALGKDFPCGIPSGNGVLLAGNSPLISLGQLQPNETCNIGPNPLSGKLTATKTVFIDFPIISTSDVKSLPVDETRKASKYVVALYVSEIHYVDGTTWAFEK